MRDPVLEMETALLITLDALLKELNVTHAATRLGITQPTMSGRLTRLRQLLGDALLIPAASGRGMVATPHAEALKPELALLMDRLRAFSSVAQAFDPATSERTFRIAATDNPAAIIAPDLIPAIKAVAPNVRLAFVLPDKARIAADLEAGNADLFVGSAEDAAGGLIGRTLFDEAFVTAQRKGHPRGDEPVGLDEFCALDHLLISTSGGSFSGMIDNALGKLGRTRKVSVSIQSYALAPLVLQGSDCVCTLPRRFLARFTTSLDLFEPPLPLARFQINAFWHSRMGDDPAHAWLREQVFETAKIQGRGLGEDLAAV